ncbi:hypothetical protein R1flu_014155 [Riccia fluitans]|uniref:Peroxidase n=1 Tax=Riccia fluitans TaxID=41844 RepID=A0ABD1YIQ9_9MARC
MFALCREQVHSSKYNPFVHNKGTSATKPTTTTDVSFVGAQVKAEHGCIVAPTLKTAEFEQGRLPLAMQVVDLEREKDKQGEVLECDSSEEFSVVQGCDASVLLDSPSNEAEKDARPNANSLRGFKEIEEIKAAIEAECPGDVSCADILALAARDAVVEVGGNSWSVALGRKDGRVSLKSEADVKIPSPFDTFDQLVQNFGAVGLNHHEMVVLSGGHTIGRASCGAVQKRLYNFGGVEGATDPSIDPKFANELKKQCPQNQQGSELSTDSSKNTFDNLYFKAVLAKKGLFESDANLLTNPVGLELVTRYSKPGSSFYNDFAAAMLKMSNIQWSTDGEIRRVCSVVNA